MEIDADCLVARLNPYLVEAEISLSQTTDDFGELKLVPAPTAPQLVGASTALPAAPPSWPAPAHPQPDPRPWR